MKALSVKQPWATLLVDGAKTIEVRSWKTSHRGQLAICASKAPNNVFMRDAADVPQLMHSGCIIGIVEIVDCRPMLKSDDDASCGNYQKDAFAWVIRPVSYCRPDPIAGRLNLFDIPDDKLILIPNTDDDWIGKYPRPQGDIKFTDSCPVL